MKEIEYLNHVVTWENYTSDTFLYGSFIKYESPDNVYFENGLLSSGSRIKEWFSKTNYQGNRISPQLPILKAGKKYRVSVNMKVVPENTIYIRINFYDRYDKLIGFENIKEKSYVFKYPENVNYYTMQLLNAGSRSLEFHSIVISENLDIQFSEDFYISELNNEKNNKNECNIVFVEPELNKIYIPSENLKNIENVVYICSTRKYAKLYNDSYLAENIELLIADLLKNYNFKRINFIGYGPIGNIASLYYGILFKDISKSWVTSTYYPEERYEELSSKYKLPNNMIQFITENKDAKVEIYSSEQTDSELEYVYKFFRYSNNIKNLPMYKESGRSEESYGK